MERDAPSAGPDPAPADVVRLSERLDVEGIRTAFARLQRVHIPNVFPPPLAARIHHSLATETPYLAHGLTAEGSTALTPPSGPPSARRARPP